MTISQNILSIALIASLAFAVFLFPFSLFFGALKLLPAAWSFMNGAIVALHAVILLFWMMAEQSFNIALRNFFLVCGIAFAVEWIGHVSGIPFGVYSYTKELGLRFLGIPVVIPMAWFSTAVASLSLAVLTLPPNSPRLLRAFAAASWVVVLDLVLEPTAAFVHLYWLWEDGVVPVGNYLSWFVISFFIIGWLISFDAVKPQKYSWAPPAIYAMQWLLFAATDLVHGYVMPVLTSLSVMVSIAAFGIRSKGAR